MGSRTPEPSRPSFVPGKVSQAKAPDQTLQEVNFLKRLIENRVPVRVRLSDNQEVDGIIEFYDTHFIRLTREGKPNLFLYKHDIKYLYELA
jgi:host factor-I protein